MLGSQVTVTISAVQVLGNTVAVDGTAKENGKDMPVHLTFGGLPEDKAYSERVQALSPGNLLTVKGVRWSHLDGHYHARNILTKGNI